MTLDFTIIIILTLLSLKHLSYDYIFIFPATLLLFKKIVVGVKGITEQRKFIVKYFDFRNH